MDNLSPSEKSGCDSDLRLERRLKRRSIANQRVKRNARENALTVDREKKQGKELLGRVDCGKIPSDIYEDSGHTKSDFDRTGNFVIDVSDDDGEDPQYKMFLENLTKNGNSYSLVVFPENGGPEVINYEIVDWLPDVSSPETPKTIQNHPVNCKINKGKRMLREVSDADILDTLHGTANLSSEEVVLSERSLRYRARNEKKGMLIPQDDVPVKRRKINSARKSSGGASGGSSRRSGSEGNCFVEQENDPYEAYIGRVKRKESSSAVRKATGETRGGSRRRSSAKGNSFVESEDETCEDYIRFLNFGLNGTSGRSFVGPSSKDSDFAEHQFDHEDETASGDESYLRLLGRHSDGASGPSDAKPGSDGNQNSEHESDENNDVDDEYMEYLDLLEMKGEDEMYKIDDNPCRFDKAEESETDSDIVVTDNDPFGGGNFTPFVSSQPSHIDLDNYSLAQDFGMASRAQFKKELIEIFKRPYYSKQYDELMQEVRCRKPIQEERNLRGKIKTYPSKTKIGKSYLDRYTDFAKLIDLAKNDKRKSLNLLRGFFYWLKNMAHDGMFQPWKDPSLLEVLPQE